MRTRKPGRTNTCVTFYRAPFFPSGWDSTSLRGLSNVPNDRVFAGYFIFKNKRGEVGMELYLSIVPQIGGCAQMIFLEQCDYVANLK